jgi:IS5 family transposase
VARRERFPAEMDAVIPCTRILALLEPHYPKARQARQSLALEKMRSRDCSKHAGG